MQLPRLGLVLAILLGSHVAGQELNSTSQPVLPAFPRVKFNETCWLFGVFRNGPNNQKEDLRNLLSIAKEIGCGIILTGFYKHYLDQQHFPAWSSSKKQTIKSPDLTPQTMKTQQPRHCFHSHVPHFMNFTDVLSREPIDVYVPTATPDELFAQGWNGELDAVVHPVGTQLSEWSTNRYVKRSMLPSHIRVPLDRVTVIPMTTPMNCQASNLLKLKAAAQGHRVIGLFEVLIGHSIKFTLTREHLDLPSDGCERSLHEASRVLQPANWLRSLAANYIAKYIAKQPDEGFVAVHIRPYPDPCLKAWQDASIQPKRKTPDCYPPHHHLHDKVGPCVSKLLAMTKAKALFVMTHPDLVPVVDQLLRGSGVQSARYLNMTDIMEMTGCVDKTATFSALVEEAIAAHAIRFLGSSLSSITHTVVLERLGAGLDNHTFFEAEHC